MTEYLTAVNCARQGNNSLAADFLKKAIQKDSSLSSYAAKDLELINVSK